MNFVDLQPREYKPIIKPLIGEHTVKPVETFEIVPFNLQQEETDSIKVKECSVGSRIICQDKNGYFKVDNLFGELKTEYDRLVARQNLGIADKYTLKWGNVLGNLVNQADLVNFVHERTNMAKDSVLEIVQKQIDELNAQSTITKLYYGPDLEHLTVSNVTTFTTGDYPGVICVLSPNYPTKFVVNGLIGGFKYIEPIIVDGVRYYEYKSTYSNLGVTEITVTYG